MTIHEEKLADADILVEAEFLARPVESADDLDREIGAAIPMRLAVLGRVTRQEDGHVRTAVISFPSFWLVAHVAAREDLRCLHGIQCIGKTNREPEPERLVLVVSDRGHHVDTIPNLVETVRAGT